MVSYSISPSCSVFNYCNILVYLHFTCLGFMSHSFQCGWKKNDPWQSVEGHMSFEQLTACGWRSCVFTGSRVSGARVTVFTCFLLALSTQHSINLFQNTSSIVIVFSIGNWGVKTNKTGNALRCANLPNKYHLNLLFVFIKWCLKIWGEDGSMILPPKGIFNFKNTFCLL